MTDYDNGIVVKDSSKIVYPLQCISRLIVLQELPMLLMFALMCLRLR